MEKVVAADIGNSRTKIGIFSDGELSETKIRNHPIEAVELSEILDRCETHKVILSTTHQESKFTSLKEKYALILLDSSLQFPIRLSYHRPSELGQDRLAAMVGAYVLFRRQNVLVADMGTCITYDVVEKSGIHLGGLISPGHKMRLRAMNEFTERLPNVQENYDISLLSQDTVSALQSGAFHGMRMEIESVIDNIEQQFGSLHVIFTGGNAENFADCVKKKIFVEPNLVLRGLYEIYKFNDK